MCYIMEWDVILWLSAAIAHGRCSTDAYKNSISWRAMAASFGKP